MLTDTKLRSLKPRANVYRVADANGLCIEVRPSGAKLWRYRYRLNGKASMATLGEYPLVPLVDARERRDAARKTLVAGVSPVAAEQARRMAQAEKAGNTFAVIAAEYLAQRVKSVSASTGIRERQLVERDLCPAIGKIAERGAVETAHRARSLASHVFRYAIQTERAERNPAADLGGAIESPQSAHFASVTDPAQVAPLLRALHAYQGSPIVGGALKLSPLVFV